jgi:hypothetical protein
VVFRVAGGAQARTDVRFYQELAIGIVVGVMTGSALQTPVTVEFDITRETAGVYQLAVLVGECIVIVK